MQDEGVSFFGTSCLVSGGFSFCVFFESFSSVHVLSFPLLRDISHSGLGTDLLTHFNLITSFKTLSPNAIHLKVLGASAQRINVEGAHVNPHHPPPLSSLLLCEALSLRPSLSPVSAGAQPLHTQHPYSQVHTPGQ